MVNLFSFGKKVKPETKEGYLTGSIPLFSSLGPAEQALIEQHSRLVGFKRGDIVYEEGTVPDAFYIIVSGRFRLFTRSRGPEKDVTLLYLYRGEHFGETSLLTGSVHSASVEAKTDAVTLRVSAESFQKLLQEIPALALHLSRSLGRHLTREELGGSHHRTAVRIAAFYFNASTDEVASFLVDFIRTLRAETGSKALVMDLSGRLKDLLPKDFRRGNVSGYDLKTMDPSNEASIHRSIVPHDTAFDFLSFAENAELAEEEKKFAALLAYLTYRYDYLIVCLPDRFTSVAAKALNHSDRVYLWAANQADVFTFASRRAMELCRDFAFNRNDIKIIMPSQEGRALADGGAGASPEIHLFSMLPSLQYQRYQYEKTLTFLAKEWSERLVGLVLGSGAAYGLAHIGALRVLEEEKIPVDVIAGASMGAVAASLWAAGYDSHEIERIAKSLDRKSAFFKLLGFADLSMPHWGFFRGNQVMRFLASYFKDMTFQDLRVPVKIVATDLLTSEEVVLDSGSVVSALRASISIPGFLRPYPHKGSFLIDGGIVDPLPVKVLSEMGVRKIIAVNVLPSPKDLIERNESRRKAFHQKFQAGSPWQRVFMKALDRIQRRYTSNIFNVVMSQIMFTEFEIARLEGSEADIFIHATVPDAHWVEFFSADKFIQEGIRKTRDQLADIRLLLQE